MLCPRRTILTRIGWMLWCGFALFGRSYAADTGLARVQGHSKEEYTIEIYYSSDLPIVGYDTNSILKAYTRRLTLERETVDNVQVNELVNALGNQRLCERGCSDECQWSFVIRESQRGSIIYQACSDAWVKRGTVGGQHIVFTDDLAKWVRKYLTVAFELEQGEYRAPVLGDKK
jgi:hypothetical protein